MVYPVQNWFHRPYNARNFTTTFQDLKNIYYSWHVAPEVVVIAGKISFWAPWVESCVSPFIVTWNTYVMGSNSFWIRNIWIFIYTGSIVPADFSSFHTYTFSKKSKIIWLMRFSVCTVTNEFFHSCVLVFKCCGTIQISWQIQGFRSISFVTRSINQLQKYELWILRISF